MSHNLTNHNKIIANILLTQQQQKINIRDLPFVLMKSKIFFYYFLWDVMN
jgi:hypothetical protein